MKTLTFKGFGIFDIADKLTLVDIAKTKVVAVEKAFLYRQYSDDVIIYRIEVLRSEKPILN